MTNTSFGNLASFNSTANLTNASRLGNSGSGIAQSRAQNNKGREQEKMRFKYDNRGLEQEQYSENVPSDESVEDHDKSKITDN